MSKNRTFALVVPTVITIIILTITLLTYVFYSEVADLLVELTVNPIYSLQPSELLDYIKNAIGNQLITAVVISTLFSCIVVYFVLKFFWYRHSQVEARLSQAIDLMNLPMWEYIAPGILHVNTYAYAILGGEKRAHSYDSQSIKELIHGDDFNENIFSVKITEENQGAGILDKAVRFLHADGHWHWLQMKGHAKCDVQGVINYATGIFVDVHEFYTKMERDQAYQRSLEQVVQEQYARSQQNDDSILYEKSFLYNIINCIPDYIYFKDTEGRILGANKAFLELMQTDLYSIRGKLSSEITYPFKLDADEVAALMRNDELAMEKDIILRTKLNLGNKDGTITPLEIFKAAFRDHLNDIIGVVGIGRDISEHIAVEDALRQAKEAASAANTAKSDFLANMSHEIRTPLNGIIGLTHLALQQDASSEVTAYLEKIDLSSKTLLKIVNDILDFSKVESGHMVLEHIPFRIGRSIQFGVDMLQIQASEKNIYLNIERQGDMPEYILGDPLRFRQVILNLLNNAVKFTSEGGVTLKVIVEQSSATQVKVTIKISDTGIGMTAKQMNNIFLPFMQADSSTTRRYGGTGLGLPITRTLVEAMGSKLLVESEVNVGTTFSFTLHAQIPTDTVQDKPLEKADNSKSLESIKNKRVLLVEDNEINQLIATEVLENFGLKVSVACDGQQGVNMALNGNFDIVLMDIQMPVMDGLTAAKTLRFNSYSKPIVAMTANAMQEDKDKARDAGMQDHIGKPFEVEALQDILIKWLDVQNKV